MPYAALRPCRQPGCRARVPRGYCAAHSPERGRPSSTARGYGRRWEKLRRMILDETPMCQAEGCNRIATQVDHILPLREGGTDERTNLQSLCHKCHSRKTAKEGGLGG